MRGNKTFQMPGNKPPLNVGWAFNTFDYFKNWLKCYGFERFEISVESTTISITIHHYFFDLKELQKSIEPLKALHPYNISVITKKISLWKWIKSKSSHSMKRFYYGRR